MGYTLLEVMVALVVLGLVMAGIAQTFRFGLTAWQAAMRIPAGPEDMAALDAALTRMIAQALPGSMTGHPDRLAFTTRLPAGAGISGLADVSIIMAPHGVRERAHAFRPTKRVPHPSRVPCERAGL